jgi:phenylalanyl-tRNA synthetase alpha chain
MSDKIFQDIDLLMQEMLATQPNDSQALESFRIRYLGTKNIIKPLFAQMKSIEPERKKEFGQVLNQFKEAAEAKYEAIREAVEAQASQHEAKDLDLTLPGIGVEDAGSRHPVSLTSNRIIDIFKRIGFSVVTDREIENEWYNFTALNTPEDHPARDMTDTYYLAKDYKHVLRSQTSTVQIRVMETQKPPIRIISPGRVYRNETISSRSHCQFHQVEGLYIDEGVSFADMKQTLLYFAREMYGPDTKIRLRPSYFPFTEPSAEMDVYWGLKTEADYRITKGTGWLEVMGCGMVDPQVLLNCGIDPEKYSGFAFGMGIERQAMHAYKINDIRQYFENDMRFLEQFKSAF